MRFIAILLLCGCGSLTGKQAAEVGASTAGSIAAIAVPAPVDAIVGPIIKAVGESADNAAKQREQQGNDGLLTTVLNLVAIFGAAYAGGKGMSVQKQVNDLYDATHAPKKG